KPRLVLGIYPLTQSTRPTTGTQTGGHMAEFKRVNFTSPKGTFVFPKLNDPDYGNNDYPKPDGEYSLKLRFKADAPETKAFIAKLAPMHAEAVANGEKA